MEPGKSCCGAITATCLCAATMLFGATIIGAESQSRSSASRTVTGQVSTVEGEFHIGKNSRGEDTLKLVDKSYVIITGTGEEMRLDLSHDTKVLNRANPGDRIEVRISREGQTLSVKRIE
jgi:hypothetical protein